MPDISRFTEAYDQASKTVNGYTFAGDWHKFLTGKIFIKKLLGSTAGPNTSYRVRPALFRKRLEKETGTEADVILKMAGVTGTSLLSTKQADAVATLKMLRHLYHVHKRGGQRVWIYASPYSFHKWVFDEMKGCTRATAKDKLNKIDEVYPKTIRKNMGNGVQQSMSWSQKCVAKLGKPGSSTKKVVERWFYSAKPSKEEMKTTASALLAGFKKITALCNSNTLIFSDEPIDRMKGNAVTDQTNYKSNWNDYAFVDGGTSRERLNVVYIQNATLKKWASSDTSWMATLAIIHELSHRLIETKDAVYDFVGLKPGATLTHNHAIVNADSWAYFAADLNGQLPSHKRASVMKEPTALRAAYLNSL